VSWHRCQLSGISTRFYNGPLVSFIRAPVNVNGAKRNQANAAATASRLRQCEHQALCSQISGAKKGEPRVSEAEISRYFIVGEIFHGA